MLNFRPRSRAFFGIFAVCATILTYKPAYSQQIQTPPDPSYYDYDHSSPVIAQETPQPDQGSIKVTTVTFPSPVTTPYPVNNTVTGYLFMPSTPGPHPVMLVLHEWLPPDFRNEFRLCHTIASANIAAFLVVQPYSFNRRPMPHAPESELLTADVPKMVAALRQSILDDRRAYDWLSQRPDIDPNRMGVTGISLGGILAGLLAGVDHRAKVVLTLVGGAQVTDILWTTPMLEGLQKGMREKGYDYDQVVTLMAPLESTRWLHDFPKRNALMFNGRYDIFVKPSNARALSQALGGAPIVWSNTGHYGIALSQDKAEEIGVRFLHSRFFDDAPFHAPNLLPSRTIKAGLLYGGQEGITPVLAYQIFNLEPTGRFSLDGQLTLHGLSGAVSAHVTDLMSVGVEFPAFHGPVKARTFVMFNVTL